jgi:DNA-binding HxlR family transcriptional regulator
LRFSDLRRKVGGVSEKMLAQTLQCLERDGFVDRTVHPVIPPHVDYRLTTLGEGIGNHVEALTDWIENNLPKILGAQQRKT